MDSAVRYMAARGVVNGMGGEMFGPQRSMTRAEFLTMLMRVLNPEPQDAGMVQQFGDVPENAYYYDAVLKAKALGIVTGVNGNQFNPDATITRQDMFVMAYNAMEKMNMLPDGYTQQFVEFDDWSIVAGYAQAPLQNLAKLKLVDGSDGNVNPVHTASRAEAAQFLYNVLKWDAK
ncbi:hypothetical protein DCMF_25265 [Candidatus Formimonas warabiya]|uniref:SLH domain-containing protein n=2 Tax=Formimonas warabiya TaxID=1761012 RepID=A0A3G1KYN3_FORW1|nr:hypothetical protein DCMF_25265 [Candidatus Formimonas warabiya]